MSIRSQPKARLKTGLPNGDFLTLTVWPGKSDPTAEVITVQIRHHGKAQDLERQLANIASILIQPRDQQTSL